MGPWVPRRVGLLGRVTSFPVPFQVTLEAERHPGLAVVVVVDVHGAAATVHAAASCALALGSLAVPRDCPRLLWMPMPPALDAPRCLPVAVPAGALGRRYGLAGTTAARWPRAVRGEAPELREGLVLVAMGAVEHAPRPLPLPGLVRGMCDRPARWTLEALRSASGGRGGRRKRRHCGLLSCHHRVSAHNPSSRRRTLQVQNPKRRKSLHASADRPGE